MKSEHINLVGTAHSKRPFLGLPADDFSAEFFGQGIQLCLDGNIQVNGQPLKNTDGPNRDLVIETLANRYKAKGEEFLNELSGGFRLALWDSQRHKLIVAVDPFATRPVYYSCVNGVLAFAPRLSCFARIPNSSTELDQNVLSFYLDHSFVPAPCTIYRGICRLEPGCYLCWQDGRLTIKQYWDIRYDEDLGLSEDDACQLIRLALEQSVRAYLEVQSCGRAELGAFLSGGTDSSTLVGLMTKAAGERLKTFSVGFSEERYNEIRYARIAASCYNADAHECFVSADEALEALPLLAAQFDEPFGNSSAIPTYFCLRMAKELGVKVLFAGDGGDELFAGNERYLAERYFLPFDILPKSLQEASIGLAAVLPNSYPFGKVRRYIQRASQPNPDRFLYYQTFLNGNAGEFFTENFINSIERDFPLKMPREHYQKTTGAAPLNRLLYMDLKMCIADNDLFKVNQMGTAAGVKVCYPYLDRKLAELTGRIPARLKLKGFEKRYIFKRAFKDLLPQEILKKKKHGFGLPIARWLRTHKGFRDLARTLLLDGSALHMAHFRQDALERLLHAHDNEQSDFYGTFIWNIIMLELWQRNVHSGAAVKVSSEPVAKSA
jgi:asparagine synthase (glutamine-hydrolysing)